MFARIRKAAARPRQHVSAAFQGIFDHYHEKLVMAYYPYDAMRQLLEQRITVQGEADLQQALAPGQGVILVTGHFGAVEFLPGVLAAKGYPVSIVVRFQTRRLAQSLMDRAATADLELIDADQGSIFLAARQALKRGRILITECDEFDEWRGGAAGVSFLGFHLEGDRSLDTLQKRSQAPVLMALVNRTGSQRYRLDITPVALPGAASDAPPIGRRCLQILEAAILAAPEQWYQWKKFGKMILPKTQEVSHAYYSSGYLASETALHHAG